MNWLVRKLALRWLKSKVKDWRKDQGMAGKAWKLFQGWRLVIMFLALIVVNWWDASHNGHSADFLGGIFSVLGLTPDAWTLTAAGNAVAHLGGLLAIGAKVWRAQKQARAGATVTELLSPEGYVKAAIAEKGVSQTIQDATGGVNPNKF